MSLRHRCIQMPLSVKRPSNQFQASSSSQNFNGLKQTTLFSKMIDNKSVDANQQLRNDAHALADLMNVEGELFDRKTLDLFSDDSTPQPGGQSTGRMQTMSREQEFR